MFLLCLLAALGVAASPAPAPEGDRVILVLGDSLSAEYGLPRDTGWVHGLSAKLRSAGGAVEYSVVNSSISGDTTQSGRTRLPQLLARYSPRIVVLELGANDGLRGLDLSQMNDNLQAMVDACRRANARVLLIGMRIPPNYGRAYADRFAQSFEALARRNRLAFVPFLMDGFADRLEWFQPDGLHPSVAAQERMLDNVWAGLQPLLRQRSD